jgi:hypothetical protein
MHTNAETRKRGPLPRLRVHAADGPDVPACTLDAGQPRLPLVRPVPLPLDAYALYDP